MKRIIAGRRAVQEALRAGAKRVSVVYLSQPERGADDAITKAARAAKVPVVEADVATVDGLAEGVRHQGVIAIGGEYPYASVEEMLNAAADAPLLVALDQVQDPHNLGAIIRSAVALGADGVITLRDRACPVTATVVRTSAGATELTRVARVTNLRRTLSALRETGMQCVGLAAEGEAAVSELPYPSCGRVLVVGSEGHGLRRMVRESCDHLARIEQPGPIASLNASVAAGIAIHDSARARRQTLTTP